MRSAGIRRHLARLLRIPAQEPEPQTGAFEESYPIATSSRASGGVDPAPQQPEISGLVMEPGLFAWSGAVDGAVFVGTALDNYLTGQGSPIPDNPGTYQHHIGTGTPAAGSITYTLPTIASGQYSSTIYGVGSGQKDNQLSVWRPEHYSGLARLWVQAAVAVGRSVASFTPSGWSDISGDAVIVSRVWDGSAAFRWWLVRISSAGVVAREMIPGNDSTDYADSLAAAKLGSITLTERQWRDFETEVLGRSTLAMADIVLLDSAAMAPVYADGLLPLGWGWKGSAQTRGAPTEDITAAQIAVFGNHPANNGTVRQLARVAEVTLSYEATNGIQASVAILEENDGLIAYGIHLLWRPNGQGGCDPVFAPRFTDPDWQAVQSVSFVPYVPAYGHHPRYHRYAFEASRPPQGTDGLQCTPPAGPGDSSYTSGGSNIISGGWFSTESIEESVVQKSFTIEISNSVEYDRSASEGEAKSAASCLGVGTQYVDDLLDSCESGEGQQCFVWRMRVWNSDIGGGTLATTYTNRGKRQTFFISPDDCEAYSYGEWETGNRRIENTPIEGDLAGGKATTQLQVMVVPGDLSSEIWGDVQDVSVGSHGGSCNAFCIGSWAASDPEGSVEYTNSVEELATQLIEDGPFEENASWQWSPRGQVPMTMTSADWPFPGPGDPLINQTAPYMLTGYSTNEPVLIWNVVIAGELQSNDGYAGAVLALPSKRFSGAL